MCAQWAARSAQRELLCLLLRLRLRLGHLDTGLAASHVLRRRAAGEEHVGELRLVEREVLVQIAVAVAAGH